MAIREKNIIKSKWFKRPLKQYTAYLSHFKKVDSFKAF